jgi:hydrogenase maturation protease
MADPSARRVAVGVGNPTMGDDGFGRAVLDELRDARCESDAGVGGADPPDRAHGTAFVGTTALLALEAMDGAERAVVVDAVDGAGEPGTVHRFPLAGADGPAVTMHDFTFAEAVERCADVYDLPERTVVVGAVPATVEPGTGVSEPLCRAVGPAARLVRAELTETTRMDGTWYCTDCEERIEPDAVDEHEAAGHGVTGRLRPDRLLSDDPWTGPEAGSTDGAAGDETAGDDTAGGADREPADRRDDGGEH